MLCFSLLVQQGCCHWDSGCNTGVDLFSVDTVSNEPLVAEQVSIALYKCARGGVHGTTHQLDTGYSDHGISIRTGERPFRAYSLHLGLR